jgi:hypothetical protein
LSSSLPVKYRLPQGYVLGPLLFITYVNDVLHLRQGRTIIYTDKTILYTGHDINELKITTSENTGLGEQCFEVNNLSINTTKTHYILF